MKSLRSEKGAALLLVIMLSAILIAAIGALMTTAHNEHRASVRSYLNTAAFSMAEAGVDFAANAITNTAWSSSPWKAKADPGGNGYIYQSQGVANGSYRVFVRAIASGYEVRSCGIATRGNNLVGQRAVLAKFSESKGSGFPKFAVAGRSAITLGNDTTGSNQGYVRVASYSSASGQPAWNGTNFGRDTFLSINSGASNSLKMNAATVYGDVSISSENTSTVYSNSRAKLVTSADDATKAEDVKVTPSEFKKNYTYDYPAPLVPEVDSNWTIITPKDTLGTSQYVYSGKPSELPAGGVYGAKYTAGTLDVGNTGKNTLIMASAGDNISKINVTGNVVLYFTQNGNLNNTVIHFADSKSTLKMYFNASLSSIPSPDSTTYSPSNYEINMLPMGSAPSATSIKASDIIAGVLNDKIKTAATTAETNAIKSTADSAVSAASAKGASDAALNSAGSTAAAKVVAAGGDLASAKAAYKAAYPAAPDAAAEAAAIKALDVYDDKINVGPGVTVNYGASGILAARINAPYSSVQLSTGNSLGANQFRGQLIGNKITTTGGDFLDIYYDTQMATSGGTTGLSVTGWRQILPSEVPQAN